jgi:hypothetical protein
MKKLFALSIVLLLVAGAAFAQIPDGFKIGGWNRMAFVPVHSVFTDGEDTANATSGIPWVRVSVDLSDNYDFVGWRFHVIADGGLAKGTADALGTTLPAIGYVGDFANLWVKPFKNDYLKINIGKFNDDVFRGKFGSDGNMDGYTASPNRNPDQIFNRFQGNGGMLLSSSPVEGLTVGALVNAGFYNSWDATQAEEVWKKIQVGAGYNIAGIGLARAQYVGGTGKVTSGAAAVAAVGAHWEIDSATYVGGNSPGAPADLVAGPTAAEKAAALGWKWVGATTASAAGKPSWSAPRIEAAFNLTAVENLNVDIGTKIPLPVTDNDITYQSPFQVNLGASYALGDFNVKTVIYTTFAEGITPDGGKISGPGFKFEIVLYPSYYLAALDATAGIEIGFGAQANAIIAGEEVKDSAVNKFGAGLFVNKGVGKGSVKTGFAFTASPEVKAAGNVNEAYKQKTTITIPIVLEYSL